VSVQLVERAMQGDAEAFGTLIHAASSRLFRVASLMLRDADRAEDATQDAIMRAWRDLPRLRDPGRFDAWLHRLVVNACYDEARRHRRRAHVSLEAAVDVPLADQTSHVLERQRIEHAFRRVPMDQRAVLVLHNHLQMSHSEIAEALDLPLGTVKSRIGRGLDALRASLAADDRLELATNRRTA
jgi:RNA polymerase sigma-70 factor, ECF subfamily